MNSYILIFLFSVFVSSISQIILKKSADSDRHGFREEYLNLPVITAYGLFFALTLLTAYAYKGTALTLGTVLEATGYVWVGILGVLVLKEKMGLRKFVGNVMIVCGILIFALM